MAELLTNGDFETWSGGLPTGWTKVGSGTVTQETTDVDTGTSAVKLTRSGATAAIQQVVTIPSSTRCRFSLRHHEDPAAPTAVLGFRIQRFDGGSATETLNPDGTWSGAADFTVQPYTQGYLPFGMEFTSMASDSAYRIWIKTVDGVTYNIWVDGASLQTLPALTAQAHIEWGEYEASVPDDQATTQAFIDAVQSVPDLIGYFSGFDEPIIYSNQAATCKALGLTPFCAWAPTNATPTATMAEINAGTFDSYLTGEAARAVAFADRMVIRFAYEFNLDDPYGFGAVDPEDFVLAWQRIHGIFQTAGATNVEWVWCANLNYDGNHSFEPFYPGDAYVDAVGLDGYSTGTTTPTAWGALFKPSLHRLMGLAVDKPVWVCETGCADAAGKAAWITSALGTEIPAEAGIAAAMYYNRDVGGNFALSSGDGSLEAFATEVQATPYFTEAPDGGGSGGGMLMRGVG